jgi:hypothetical protein
VVSVKIVSLATSIVSRSSGCGSTRVRIYTDTITSTNDILVIG